MIIYGKDRDIIIDTDGSTLEAREVRIRTDSYAPCIVASNRPEIGGELHAPEGFTIVTRCESINAARNLIGSLALAIAENKRFAAVFNGQIIDCRS